MRLRENVYHARRRELENVIFNSIGHGINETISTHRKNRPRRMRFEILEI